MQQIVVAICFMVLHCLTKSWFVGNETKRAKQVLKKGVSECIVFLQGSPEELLFACL